MKCIVLLSLMMCAACAPDVSQITVVLRPDDAMRSAKIMVGPEMGEPRYRVEFEVFDARGNEPKQNRRSVELIPDEEEAVDNQLWPHRIAIRPISEDVLTTGLRVEAVVSDEQLLSQERLEVGAQVDAFLSKETLEFTVRLDSSCLGMRCASGKTCIDPDGSGPDGPLCYDQNVPAECLEPFDPAGADDGRDHVETIPPQLVTNNNIVGCSFVGEAPTPRS